MSGAGTTNLPAGWASIALQEAGRWYGGGTPSKSNEKFWAHGQVPWVSPKDMKTPHINDSQDHITEEACQKSATNVIDANCILFVVRSGILRHSLPVAVNSRPVTLNQDLKAISPHPGISAEYLAHALRAKSGEILHQCSKTGTTVQSIEIPLAKRFRIPLAPSQEQMRIVEKLEELITDLDAGVEALEQVKKGLGRYRASVLKAAVEGRLTEKWRAEHPDVEPASELLRRILAERRRRWEEEQLAKYKAKGQKPPKNWKAKYKEPAAPDASSLPELPKEWCWASLEQLVAGGNYGTSVKCAYEATGMPVLRIPNIDRGEIDLADMKYAKRDLGNLGDGVLQAGDLLVCRTNGSIDLLGKAAVVRSQFPKPHYFASYLIRFRPVDVDLAPYIHRVFLSFWGRRFIEGRAASSAGQHNISLSKLNRLPVPLPSSPELPAVMETLESMLPSCDALEQTSTVAGRRALRLRQGILKRAFEGKLVPQDPKDEPAFVLLERIRAERERAKAEGGKKTRPRRRPRKPK